MICKTSEVAACCSNDSLNCRSSNAIFVLWSAVALRRLPVFGVLAALGATVLRLRAIGSLLPVLERRRIAIPRLRTTPIFKIDYSRDLRPAKRGLRISLHGNNL
jgi:hypothetical protein